MALRGTLAPEGASPGRRPADATYREVGLWPGITWGRTADCLCSWAVRYGAAQVKVRSGACTVHLPGRGADPEPERPELPLTELLDQLIGVLAEIFEEERKRWCGTWRGYRLHKADGTGACPACLEAGRARDRKRKRASRRAGAVRAAA